MLGAELEWNPLPKETFMRIIALVIAGALAVCFMGPASAATKRSAAVANTDKSAAPASAGCGGSVCCYRGGRQKIQKKHCARLGYRQVRVPAVTTAGTCPISDTAKF